MSDSKVKTVAPTEEQLSALKADYDTLYELPFDDLDVGYDITFIAKHPSKAVFNRFTTGISNEKKRAQAIENLFVDCVVFPSGKDLEDIQETYPALVYSAGNKLSRILGMNEDDRIRKL